MKKNIEHLSIPKFVLQRNELQKVKGGADVPVPGCCDCGCSATTNAGCISGPGTDLGKKAANPK